MIDYRPLFSALLDAKADDWVKQLPTQLESSLDPSNHGDLQRWRSQVENLPLLSPSERIPNADAVRIGRAEDLSEQENKQLHSRLMALQPWRKGPYEVFGINIDAEWRSDWKWNRLKDHIAPLRDKLVLDVGCGNGYHCWRILGAGAKMVIGLDPMLLNIVQFQMIRKLYGDAPVYVLPLGIEQLPEGLRIFNTVFSMGVLYHRRSPIDHLLQLRDCLKTDGELVLETLVVNGGPDTILFPEDRYAHMRNVWFLPSCDAVISWLKRCGYSNIRLVDVTPTTEGEQRSTPWMPFHSLNDFLDPGNPNLTREGYPAPTRAIFIANRC